MNDKKVFFNAAVRMYKLAWRYLRNINQGYDEAKALMWLKKSAELGYDKAQQELGAYYYDGEMVQKDYTKAAEWFRKAAEQGNAEAQYRLGMCYKYGEGVERDSAKSAEWFRKAAEQGHVGARWNLDPKTTNL